MANRLHCRRLVSIRNWDWLFVRVGISAAILGAGHYHRVKSGHYFLHHAGLVISSRAFLLPNDRLSWVAALGLVLAVTGVVWAIGHRTEGQMASLFGDLAALGAALCWAAIGLTAHTKKVSQLIPEQQLLWQLAVSAPVLMVAALWFGPALRDLEAIHLYGLLFQSTAIACFGF